MAVAIIRYGDCTHCHNKKREEESNMFSKKPSFDESPLQDLSEDQMTQVAGGCDSSKKSWDWKHHHHHHHWMKKTNPVKVEVIVTLPNGKKETFWETVK
jgi:hypothetical protein